MVIFAVLVAVQLWESLVWVVGGWLNQVCATARRTRAGLLLCVGGGGGVAERIQYYEVSHSRSRERTLSAIAPDFLLLISAPGNIKNGFIEKKALQRKLERLYFACGWK
jgi:hypothetical protein